MPVEAPAIVTIALRPEHWPEVARIYAEGSPPTTPPLRPMPERRRIGKHADGWRDVLSA
jgi:hypothetical protein